MDCFLKLVTTAARRRTQLQSKTSRDGTSQVFLESRVKLLSHRNCLCASSHSFNIVVFLSLLFYLSPLNISVLSRGLRWQRICLQCRRLGFSPWVGKIPWRKEWLLTPVFLPKNPWEIPWTEEPGRLQSMGLQ